MRNMDKRQGYLVALNAVSKSYHNISVLKSVSFGIEFQSINIIIGPNGAGKSSLAKLIVGLDNSFTGTIQYPNEQLKIVYLPQKLNISPYLPISSNALFHHMSDNNTIQDDELIESIKKFCSLDIIGNTQASQLSGGNLQKLFIAQALINKADLIVFDEPTQNLDIFAETEFYKLLLLRRQKLKTTFILISHDIHAILKFADKVICINNHICCTGNSSDIDTKNPFMSLYLHHHDHRH